LIIVAIVCTNGIIRRATSRLLYQKAGVELILTIANAQSTLITHKKERFFMNPVQQISGIDPAKKAFSLVEEFKGFAFKGNVIDMAVGIIIGAVFGKIIDSLVKHIIMPVIGLLLPGNQGYLGWKIAVGAKEVPYGLFIGEVVNFLIIAAVLFVFIVKFLGWLMRSKQKEVAVAPAPPALTRDQQLLAEIRDLLKNKN
jgi:large conductance mechanosensitive channel